MNALPLLRNVNRRAGERQSLIPRDGPTAIQKFYRQMGHLEERANAPARAKAWLTSWWSGYVAVPDREGGKTEEEYEADGRNAVRAGFAKALKLIPGGKAVNAFDTEMQAIHLWWAAQQTANKELSEAIECIALLQEGRAAGQATTAPLSLVSTQYPFLEKLAKPVAKMAVRWITRRLSEAVASADRAALAETIHRHALAELEAQEQQENEEEDRTPEPTEYTDPRHAMYALVVLRVSLGLLKLDLAEQEKNGLPGTSARAALALVLNRS